MAIFKRGKIYWFHFIFEGEHIQKSTHQTNARVARQIESAERTRLAKREVGIEEPKRAPLFAKAMKDFLVWSEQEHKTHPRTHQRYQTSSKALLFHFKDKKIDKITPEDVERFKSLRAIEKNKRTGKALRPATINRELACLKALFNFAIKGDLVLKNPVSRIKFYDEDNEQMRTLNYEEERLYLSTASQPLKDVATLMLETGMRPEEVYRIKAENINLDSSYLFNPYGKTKAAKRKVPLNKTAHEVIKKRLDNAKGSYLFPSPDDPEKSVLKLNNAHYGALKRSGIKKFRLYDLRHTWATRAAMSGIDLVTLATMLGHSRIQMVLRYAHPTEQHQSEAMRKLEEFNLARQMAEIENRQQPATMAATVIN